MPVLVQPVQRLGAPAAAGHLQAVQGGREGHAGEAPPLLLGLVRTWAGPLETHRPLVVLGPMLAKAADILSPDCRRKKKPSSP